MNQSFELRIPTCPCFARSGLSQSFSLFETQETTEMEPFSTREFLTQSLESQPLTGSQKRSVSRTPLTRSLSPSSSREIIEYQTGQEQKTRRREQEEQEEKRRREQEEQKRQQLLKQEEQEKQRRREQEEQKRRQKQEQEEQEEQQRREHEKQEQQRRREQEEQEEIRQQLEQEERERRQKQEQEERERRQKQEQEERERRQKQEQEERERRQKQEQEEQRRQKQEPEKQQKQAQPTQGKTSAKFSCSSDDECESTYKGSPHIGERVYKCVDTKNKENENLKEMSRLAEEAQRNASKLNSNKASKIRENISKILILGQGSFTPNGKELLYRIDTQVSACIDNKNSKTLYKLLCQDLYELVTRLKISANENCQ